MKTKTTIVAMVQAQGRVHIPKKIREIRNIKEGDYLEISFRKVDPTVVNNEVSG